MNEEYPVTVSIERNGRTEEVRVGTAVRSGEGFTLRFLELRIHTGAAVEAQARRSAPIASPPGGGMIFPNYGRSKGQPIAGATMGDLEYYAAGARRSLADPAKARFHDKERVLLAAIEAEITRQNGMPPMDR